MRFFARSIAGGRAAATHNDQSLRPALTARSAPPPEALDVSAG